jgi:ribosomal protein L11 methyltransferase
MEYIQVSFAATAEQADILVAVLSHAGFEMFEETEDGLHAFIPSASYTPGIVEKAIEGIYGLAGVRFEVRALEDKNWNEEWERNFPPVWIQKTIYIRSSFHPSSEKAEYEILIDPKMSFGTGHHDTTSMMLQHMLHIELEGRNVLDMGCGSGILAIFASMRGARYVEAIDTDEWAVRNATENCATNRVNNVTVIGGDVSAITRRDFDVVLANINRNILLRDMEAYARHLLPGGHLVMSGFLPEDEAAIQEQAATLGFRKKDTLRSGNWASVHLLKQTGN